MHSTLKWIAALTLATGLGTVSAAETTFRLEDVRGDDHGAGTLMYPNRPDMQQGDLDLVALSVRSASDGSWFTVEMARPVRDPQGQVTAVGQLPLQRLARHGFYTFNVDVYIDRDRKAGSGRTETVPGRKVDVERTAAWERAVILSPRPEVARSLLLLNYTAREETELRAKQGRVSKTDLDSIESRVQQDIDEHFYFPNRIRVSGKTVEFFVPTTFLGEPASPDWAYTVFVTGADVEQLGRVDFNPTNRPQMMTMPVERGIKPNTFGLRSDSDLAQAPVVDVLAITPGVQKRALEDYDVMVGRLAALPPATRAIETSEGAPSVAADATTAPKPDVGGATGAAEAPAGAAQRLRTLNELLEKGLITPEEHAELRRKVLSQL